MPSVSFRVPIGRDGTFLGVGAWERVGWDGPLNITPSVAGQPYGALNPWSNYAPITNTANVNERGFQTPTTTGNAAIAGASWSAPSGTFPEYVTLTLDESLLGKNLIVYTQADSGGTSGLRVLSTPPLPAGLLIARVPGSSSAFTFRLLADAGSTISLVTGQTTLSPVSLQIDIAGNITTHAPSSTTRQSYATYRNGFNQTYLSYECIGTRDVLPDYNSAITTNRTVKVRAIDEVGRFSPWVTIHCLPNPVATAQWDSAGEYLEVDLSGSWDLDGVVASRTFTANNAPNPGNYAFEMVSPTLAKIALSEFVARGINTANASQSFHRPTDNEGNFLGVNINIPALAALASRRLWQVNGNARTVWQCSPLDASQTTLKRFDAGAKSPTPVSIRSFGKVSIPALVPQPGHRTSKGAKNSPAATGPLYVANTETDSSIRLYAGVDLGTSNANWLLLGTMWTSPPASWHFILLPGGGAATLAVRTVAGVRGLYFKRTANLATWPTDAQAVLVSTSISSTDEFEIRNINGTLEAWNNAGAKFRALNGGATSSDWLAA